jgi:CRP-like cAMP-binding protein
MENNQIFNYIRQISALPDQHLALLVKDAVCKVLKKGECLIRQGQVHNDYYLVQSGYLRTFYDKEGVDINIHFTFEGSFTNDLKSLKSRQPSMFTIAAGESTVVWVFNRKALADLCNTSADILLFSRRLLSVLLIRSEEHSSLFKIYTPAERYRYIEKNNPGLLQRVSLSQLASYLGVTRETLSRIRRRSLNNVL